MSKIKTTRLQRLLHSTQGCQVSCSGPAVLALEFILQFSAVDWKSQGKVHRRPGNLLAVVHSGRLQTTQKATSRLRFTFLPTLVQKSVLLFLLMTHLLPTLYCSFQTVNHSQETPDSKILISLLHQCLNEPLYLRVVSLLHMQYCPPMISEERSQILRERDTADLTTLILSLDKSCIFTCLAPFGINPITGMKKQLHLEEV